MKFAWETKLVDFAQSVIVDEKGDPIILGNLIISALMTQDRKELDGVAKFKRFQLASKIQQNQDIDVTEAALIKEVCGNVLTPLPVGRIWELLNSPQS
jgi:hypothetical protein